MKNKYEIRGDVTVIYLVSSNNIYEAIIDTADFEIVNSIPTAWSLKKSTNTDYVRTQMRKDGKRVCPYLHRLLINPPDNMDIDHVNHNGLDNRRSNLRVVTESQNHQNRKGPRSDNKTSGVRGVMWHKQRGRWVVTLQINKKSKHFGFFDDKDEAELVAKHARAKYMPYSIDAEEISDIDDALINKYKDRAYRSNKSSGIKGVSWNNVRKQWRVFFTKDKKKYFFGWFDELEVASKVAEEAKDKLGIVK